MTKEELLQKGISESDADKIITALDNTGTIDPLANLEKALNKDNTGKQESLFKAADNDEDDKKGKGKEKDEDDDDGDYDEEYMKKYMKKYMKANKKACAKTAKDVGLFEGEMKKAMENVDMNADAGVIDVIDLKPILENQGEYNSAMAKAIQENSSQVIIISAKVNELYDLMEKAAQLQVAQAKALDVIVSQPQGRKGVVTNADMSKAVEPVITPEQTKVIYGTLMKAVKAGDLQAGQIISTFESAGHNVMALKQSDRQYISELMAKK